MNTLQPQRGISLLVAVILTAVILSVALSLLDITYKQVVLASSAKQSQYAFYNADSAIECALYWDQQKNAFSYTASSYLTNGITCADTSGNTQNLIAWSSNGVNNSPNSSCPNSTCINANTRTTVLTMPCTGGGTSGLITVTKSTTGATSIFATGYSSCSASDPRRIERGLKVCYGGVCTSGAGASSGGSGGSGSNTYVVLQTGSSWTIPAGVTSIKVWAVGGGGGGAGAPAIDATSGGGGGAGGVAYKTISVTPGQTLSYAIGAGGAGGAGAANGSWGGNTTVTYTSTFLVGGGGGFGQYNNNTASPLGTFSGGDGGANGGVGPGTSGDNGGTGGGGIGGADGTNAGHTGGNGGQAADVSGLQAAVTGAGISWTAPGTGADSGSSPVNGKNGSTATGFGSGGGGAGYYGGNGGNGIYGGGGGGAAGLGAVQTGGNGGTGAVVIQY